MILDVSQTLDRPGDREALAQAAALLRAGELVAFPTETVYGLGGDATNDDAVAAIFAAKGRPQFNPLIAHVADAAAAENLAVFDDRARALARAFWPGPLTLVLPRRADCPVSLLASAGLETLAVRVPAHPVAHALLCETDRPVCAPSANLSGHVSPTTAGHVCADLGDRIAAIIDAGPCGIGLESTVVDLSGPDAILLRPGGITPVQIEAVIGTLATEPTAADEHVAAPKLKSPGQLSSHYAPNLPVRLDACAPLPGRREALLAFGQPVPEGFATVANLSENASLCEAAARLFTLLRELDRTDADGIAVMPIRPRPDDPDPGLELAIIDRLRRAAAPR